MKREIFQNLYDNEEKYWWFVGQRYLVDNFLNKYYKGKKGLKLLDVGCGTGINMQFLDKFGKAHGIDVSDDAIDFCRMRNTGNVKKSDVMDIKFPKNHFDVVTVFGVFYHKAVKDDIKAMKEIYRVLKPGGRFFIFDCAMMCLYGKHDIAFDGARRYSKKELKEKMQKAGFNVEKVSYANTLFFPLVYTHRKISNLSKSKPKSDVDESINPVVNSILKSVYKTELKGIEYFNYPFGVNIFGIGRK